MKHPTRRRHARLAATTAVVTLAAAAPAGALPAVYSSDAKIVPAGQTPQASWTQADLQDEQRYVVTDNGFTYALRESNGKLDHGALTYDVLPATYRALIPVARKLAEGDTGAQPHATCDVASLTSDEAIRSWQGSDPAYNYVPFQATTAGLGDDPAAWLSRVKTLTGLTLGANTNLNAACAGLGGTFVPADTVVSAPTVFGSGLTTPLTAQIAELTKSETALKAKVAEVTKAKDAADAQVKKLTLEATTFKLAVNSAATLARGLEVDVTGPPNRPVFVRVLVTEAQRRFHKLAYKTLGSGSGVTDAKGKVRVIAQPRRDTAPFLLKRVDAVPVSVYAFSGDRAATIIVPLGG